MLEVDSDCDKSPMVGRGPSVGGETQTSFVSWCVISIKSISDQSPRTDLQHFSYALPSALKYKPYIPGYSLLRWNIVLGPPRLHQVVETAIMDDGKWA